jgi:SNF2 family DNA or RNA helicase
VWDKGYNASQGREYDILLGYRNMDELREVMASVASRVTKDDVLDLPPKLYGKRYHELGPTQKRLYEQLRDDFIAELDNGVVDASLAIVRLLRFQQIVCGYLPNEDGEMIQLDDGGSRLALLGETLEGLGHKAIIWARFREDINRICDMLGDRAVRYDGAVSEDEAALAKEQFQKGDAQFFVGNPAKGATGLTLHAARTVVYYSNSFKLVDRLQSEDRAHRIGQEHPVNYIDLVCPGTVDEHIVEALRKKNDIATALTGDELKDWI